MDYFDFHTNHFDQFQWSIQSVDNGIGKNITAKKTIPVIRLEGGFGKMDFEFYDYSEHGFGIWINEYQIKRKRTFHAAMEGHFFELSIQILNQESFHLKGFGDVSMRCGQYNFFFLPEVENEVEMFSGEQYMTIDIHYSMDYIQKEATLFPDILGPMLDKAVSKKASQLLPVPAFLPIELQMLVKELLHLLNREAGRPHMIVYAVRYLTIRALIHGSNLVNNSYQPYGKSQNINIAEHTLLEDLQNFTSLDKLCRIARVNRNDLEKYFNANFNKTVYTYWNDYRMSMAFEAVINNIHSIAEISELFGFKEPPSFTRAFKQKFKITPMDLRKSKI